MVWKSGTAKNFFITANSLERQRQLETNSVVIKRVDCRYLSIFGYKTKPISKLVQEIDKSI